MSRRRRLRLARSVSLVVLLALAGYLVAARGATPRPRPSPDESLRSTTTEGKAAITPAARDVGSGTEDLFTLPSIAAYLSSLPDDLTAAVYDDSAGHTSLYRPGVAEDTASIMKVDILATLLSEAQAQNRSLTPDEQALSQAMIEESDDDDAQDLWDAEGGAAAVNSFDHEAGLTQTDPDAAGYWGLSTTTAADQVKLLKEVAYPNNLLTAGSRGYELDLMTHVDPSQAWGVTSGVSPDATVAIKNGWLPLDAGGWQVNSIGYIHGAGRDYLVAVLSDSPNEADGIAAIEGLSALIWKDLRPTRA